MDKVKLGIVGLGRLGRQHAHNIKYLIREAELHAVCSILPEEIEKAKQDFAPPVATSDFEDLLSIRELDGLVIASNSQTHCEMICRA